MSEINYTIKNDINRPNENQETKQPGKSLPPNTNQPNQPKEQTAVLTEPQPQAATTELAKNETESLSTSKANNWSGLLHQNTLSRDEIIKKMIDMSDSMIEKYKKSLTDPVETTTSKEETKNTPSSINSEEYSSDKTEEDELVFVNSQTNELLSENGYLSDPEASSNTKKANYVKKADHSKKEKEFQESVAQVTLLY